MLVPLSASRRPLRTELAETLAQIPQTLQPEALETQRELDAFYKEGVQVLRGSTRIGQLGIDLQDQHAADLPCKAFLLGHPGVGKTTELSRLLLELKDLFRPLRISVTTELNPATLRSYDVLLLILMRLVNEVSQPSVIGFEDTDLAAMVDRVREHLARKWTKRLRIDQRELGAGLSIPFLKLFGNIKLAGTREQGVEEYELSLVSDLVELMNSVLLECNRLLAKHQNGRQWLIVLEDLEKTGLTSPAMKDLFTQLRPSLQGLDANLVIIIPVWLQYSEDAGTCLPPNFHCYAIPDIAVYTKVHDQDGLVIAALKEVVTARVRESLFEEEALTRLCIASGGNLRDLFSLIRNAMSTARLRHAATISSADAERAIASLRHDYKQLLGSTGEDTNETPLAAKLDRLVGIYLRKDPTVEVPDKVLYLLLRQRCALQYNGAGWIGIHPLVVDLLIEFGRIPADSPGGSKLA